MFGNYLKAQMTAMGKSNKSEAMKMVVEKELDKFPYGRTKEFQASQSSHTFLPASKTPVYK